VIGWKPQFTNPQVASVRYRCLNPLAELRQRHFPVELFTLESLAKYSAVIFSKSYDEKSYDLAKEIKGKGIKIIFDLCDNHFYNPCALKKFDLVRIRLMKMLELADFVVTSTEELARTILAEAQLLSTPAVIGDAIEKEDFLVPQSRLGKVLGAFRAKEPSSSETATILWYGIHGGENAPYGMLDLLNIQEHLSRLRRDYPFRLVVVSNSRTKYKKYIKPLPFETEYYEWGYTPFRNILRHASVNILPITKNPFTICKSNNRLALALYEGVPSVADEIPSYKELAPFCVLNDWERGLRLYLSNKNIAKEHVEGARAYIERTFTITQIADQWQAQLSRFL
jgi:glycosyltransferase involved in cell wall biosynthesis